MKKQIDVLYQFNEKYVPYAGASITSLLENNGYFEKIRIFVLGEGIQEESKERFQRLVTSYRASDKERTLVFVETDALIARMKEMNMPAYRGSYAANMRLFLSGLLPEDVDRLLYLDGDTIVDAPLDDLLSFPMTKEGEDMPLAMALDSLVRLHKFDIGLKLEDAYYNSGVILFSMKNWEKCRCSERIADHVQKVRSHYPSPDQDLLNVVCKGQIITLPATYNMQPIHLAFSLVAYFRHFKPTGYYTEAELTKAVEHPIIYHFFRFVGEFPWHKDTLHPDKALFDRYIALSPWCDYEKKPAENGLVLKIEKILFRVLPRDVFIILFHMAHQHFTAQANKLSLQNKTHKEM